MISSVSHQKSLLLFLLFSGFCYATGSLTQLQEVFTNTESVCRLASQPQQQQQNQQEYGIGLSDDIYVPGKSLTVSVRGNQPYKALLIQARSTDSSAPIGSFSTTPPAHLIDELDHEESQYCQKTTSRECALMILYNCAVIADTLYAFNSDGVNMLSITWASPSNYSGLVQFVATVYIDEARSITVKSELISKGFQKINLDGCGETKGCYRYGSKDCTARTCQYVLTYRAEGSEAEFEMSGNADWVAVGFSSDNKMGGDDVFICSKSRYSSDSEVSVRRYAIELSNQPPVYKQSNPLYAIETDQSITDRVTCRFKRPLKVTTDVDPFSLDLSNNWYQLYAWGSMSSSGSFHKHSMERPPTSEDKVTLRQSRNVMVVVSSASNLVGVQTCWSLRLKFILLLSFSGLFGRRHIFYFKT